MDSDLKWIVGLAVSISGLFAITLIGAFRNLAGRITLGSGEIHKKIDDVKDRYVRRDDLDVHIKRLEGSIHDLRVEAREHSQQVLQAISNIQNSK